MRKISSLQAPKNHMGPNVNYYIKAALKLHEHLTTWTFLQRPVYVLVLSVLDSVVVRKTLLFCDDIETLLLAPEVTSYYCSEQL